MDQPRSHSVTSNPFRRWRAGVRGPSLGRGACRVKGHLHSETSSRSRCSGTPLHCELLRRLRQEDSGFKSCLSVSKLQRKKEEEFRLVISSTTQDSGASQKGFPKPCQDRCMHSRTEGCVHILIANSDPHRKGSPHMRGPSASTSHQQTGLLCPSRSYRPLAHRWPSKAS